MVFIREWLIENTKLSKSKNELAKSKKTNNHIQTNYDLLMRKPDTDCLPWGMLRIDQNLVQMLERNRTIVG